VAKDLATHIRESNKQVARQETGVPTPLYVTMNVKKVTLAFITQEEADRAYRMLSALANAHADRAHAIQDGEDQLLLDYHNASNDKR
jgi:hypothetical protein